MLAGCSSQDILLNGLAGFPFSTPHIASILGSKGSFQGPSPNTPVFSPRSTRGGIPTYRGDRLRFEDESREDFIQYTQGKEILASQAVSFVLAGTFPARSS